MAHLIHADDLAHSLGESLDGAFALWDPLINSIAYHDHHHFVPALVIRLQAQLVDTHQSSRDVQCEAVALWLLHIQAYVVSTPEYVQVKTMRMCCLHPGHWTKVIGQALLELNEELHEEWRKMFEASMLAEGGEKDVDATSGAEPARLEDVEPDESESKDLSLRSSVGGLSLIESFGGWRRAPFSPLVPIGVVA